MPFNLIEDSWVPVRRSTGPPEYIPPWEVSRLEPEPWLELAAGRPDLGGATYQMLVGLLQVACAPENDEAWRDWFQNPPQPETLRQKMLPLKAAFDLQGKHPFMQDTACPPGNEGFPLAQLLPDQPAGNTLKLNKDLFVKEPVMDGLCAACLAPALYWRQTSMGGFGGGFRDSLRLKRVMTVLVLGENLWQTLWLNVLDRKNFQALTLPGPEDMAARFPWMGEVRRSTKGETVLPGQVHADQLYWPMSQSILVDFSRSTPDALCPGCGRSGQELFHFFHRRKHGPLYQKAGWKHPLTPYSRDDSGQPVFVEISSGGVSFGDWLGVALKGEYRKTRREPPPVVNEYYHRLNEVLEYGELADYRARVFGVEMDQAKTLSFVDSLMPLLPLPDEDLRAELGEQAEKMVAVAEMATLRLRGAVKDALFGKGDKPKFDAGVLGLAMRRLWDECEEAFYQTMGGAGKMLLEHEPYSEPNRALLEGWLAEVSRRGRAIFDELTDSDTQQWVNPGRWAKASIFLDRSLGVRTKVLRTALGLPEIKEKTE